MNNILAVLVLVIGFTFSAFGSDDFDPGCPPVPDLTEAQREQVDTALSEGKTVIRCFEGLCWDIITGEDMQHQGVIPDDGVYAIVLTPWDQPLPQ